MPRIGVLALQGAFQRHIDALSCLGAHPIPVRLPGDLAHVDGLVLPGGESTTMSLLLGTSGLAQPISAFIADGLPIFGTCAGMILLAAEVLDGRPDQMQLATLDFSVRRNGYGRQLASFEADVTAPILGIGDTNPFRAIFIRAPKVENVGDGIEVLARLDHDPVLIRSGPVMASAFHPELTPDLRLHRCFLASL